MQYRLAIFGLVVTIIVATLATGCPSSGSGGTDQAKVEQPAQPAVSANTSGSEKPAAGTNTAQEAGGAAEGQKNGGNPDEKLVATDEELVATKDTLEFPERKGDPSLEGKWFGLFGQHDLGLLKHAWVDGHSVEFRQNGQAFWYKVVNGAEVNTMDSQWRMEGSHKIRVSFSEANAVESGMNKLAPLGLEPMGIGSDEEIGLAKSNLPGGNASAMVLLDNVMDIQLDHNYLVIRDSYSRLMVYGREPSEALEIPEGIEGDWVGKGSSNRRFEAQFELTGQQLDIVMDHKTKKFSGVFTQGYFVGELMSPKGMELVAFYYDDLGFLDGVRYTKPFRVVSMEYEFVKAPNPV